MCASDKFKDHVEGSMTPESVIFCFSPSNYHTVSWVEAPQWSSYLLILTSDTAFSVCCGL